MSSIAPCFLLLMFSVNTIADENHRPANFDVAESKRQLAELIEFPEAVSGKVALTLSCFSQIRENGKMDVTGCYQKDQYEASFAATVVKAAKKARLNPARLNGKTVDIFLQFRIHFARETEGEGTVTLFLNPGYEENVLEYGFEHIAGQRAFAKKEPWMDACPSHAGFTVWARAFLSPEGRAGNPTIEFGNGIRPTAPCLDAIKQTIVAGHYIPAFAEGEPVPSTYIEIFSN